MEGIEKSWFSQDGEGGLHCISDIWATYCKEPQESTMLAKRRASEEACVGKSLVCSSDSR